MELNEFNAKWKKYRLPLALFGFIGCVFVFALKDEFLSYLKNLYIVKKGFVFLYVIYQDPFGQVCCKFLLWAIM